MTSETTIVPKPPVEAAKPRIRLSERTDLLQEWGLLSTTESDQQGVLDTLNEQELLRKKRKSSISSRTASWMLGRGGF